MNKIKAEIIQEIAKACLEVIGENDRNTKWPEDSIVTEIRNELRAEQRKVYNRIIKRLANE